jgi:hypothetical protein
MAKIATIKTPHAVRALEEVARTLEIHRDCAAASERRAIRKLRENATMQALAVEAATPNVYHIRVLFALIE